LLAGPLEGARLVFTLQRHGGHGTERTAHVRTRFELARRNKNSIGLSRTEATEPNQPLHVRTREGEWAPVSSPASMRVLVVSGGPGRGVLVEEVACVRGPAARPTWTQWSADRGCLCSS
jgi:hypothetical protein